MLFHVAGTWNLPLVDRDEPRFAEASREMIERNDYVIPYFNNHFRFDKPPLTYWAQVASYRLLGENDFAARFPSTIAAALTALLILAWGSRLRPASASQARIGTNRVGWWAAIIFTLSLQTFVHAKAAVADMWLVFFVTLAQWAGYELLFGDRERKRSNWLWWSAFYLSLAFAFLAKGPIGWLPLLSVGATILFARKSELAGRFKFVPGIVLMLAVIGRSFGAMEGHGANSLGLYLFLLPFYFVAVFASFFPWSIKLPWLARRLWKSRDKIDNYLLTGTAIIFVIFTLVKTKLPHYTLPAFPLLALLLARQLEVAQFSERTFRKFATAAAISLFGIALLLPSALARFFPAADLFRQSRSDLVPGMEFGAVDFAEPSLVWYFRGRVKGFMTPLHRDSVGQFMEKNGPRFVIVPANLVPGSAANWKTFSSHGVNVAKGKRVDLELLLKPE